MERNKKIIHVCIVGIATNVVLVSFKAFAGFITGSVAIMLDALNNLSDALSQIITIIGTKLSSRGPDKKHPYGHGRIEYISSVVIAIIIFLAGVTAFREATDRIIHPQAAEYTTVSLVIVSVAVLVKFFLSRYVRNSGRKYNSAALVTSGKESFFDALISLSTLAAAGISLLWQISIEAYLGLLISLLIIKTGVELLLNGLSSIIGARVESGLGSSLRRKINSYDQVFGAFDLILHKYGPEKIIGSVHIEVSDKLTAKDIHRLTRRISQDVLAEFGVILTVGIYASYANDAAEMQIKDSIYDATLEILRKYPQVIEIHGFFIEIEERRVSFDMIVDFKEDAVKIRDEIRNELAGRHPEYDIEIYLDSYYVD